MRVAAVILAAGRGERLGGRCKAALVLPDGRSFLRAIVDTAAAAAVDELVVVGAAPHWAQVRALAAAAGVVAVENPRPERGMASSFAVGLAALASAPPDVALVWPVDHPAVAVATLRAVLAQAGPAAIVVPVFGERGGHPTAMGAELFAACSAAADAQDGLRAVLAAHRTAVRRVTVADAGVRADIDEPHEYARLWEEPS